MYSEKVMIEVLLGSGKLLVYLFVVLMYNIEIGKYVMIFINIKLL